MSITDIRQPHASLDVVSRTKKAQKIDRLLKLQSKEKPIRILEIGAGSGHIAHYFVNRPNLRSDVFAVDVEDQRQVFDGYTFATVKDTHLPFADEWFDVVISNQVIEHVGEREAQKHHLSEIRRVLAADGVAYLAAPNRWMLIEPHFKLAFLSWLPRSLRSAYVRLRGRGTHYDCEPLSLSELDQMLLDGGFEWQHVEVNALRETIAIEGSQGAVVRLVSAMPDSLIERLRPIIPTLICILRKPRVNAEIDEAQVSRS